MAMIDDNPGVDTLVNRFEGRTNVRDFEEVVATWETHEREAFQYIVQSQLLWRLSL
jgi:hypothetical protein